MNSLDERIALMRGVGFFIGLPPEALISVAEALVSVDLEPGAPLFAKGDVGDSMYVIASGTVRIHDGDLTFNELGPGDVVGEMAVLDAEPRSASVTAITATTLLCLDQGHLYRLITEHLGVARGVIQILCRHLRARVSDLADDFAYIRQVQMIASAAQAIEEGRYKPEMVALVTSREDALGQLARVFQHMADEVIAREHRLRREVQELRIEIDRKRQEQEVAQITASDYFRDLQQRAKALRADFTDEHEGHQT